MRLFLIGFVFYTSQMLSQVTDDFSDGNFSANPSWYGDSSHFKVTSEVLHLNAPGITDTSFLITPSMISLEASWNIRVNLNFNPSSSNYARIYLISDDQNLRSPVHGYFVKIGSSKDDISLYRQDGEKEIILIDGKDGRINMSTSSIFLKVLRDSSFTWTLLSDTSGSINFKTEGKIQDSTYKSSKYFGIFCRYTSSRSTKFSFDDITITGKVFVDKIRPYVVSNSIVSNTSWRVDFSEKLNYKAIKAPYFSFSTEDLKIQNTQYDSILNAVTVISNKAFPHGKLLSLSIDSIRDIAGNIMKPISIQDVFNSQDSIFLKDLIINEIMADPDPPVELPASEYIELFNRSNNHIKLGRWAFADSRDTIDLPAITLEPESYLLLIDAEDSVLWSEIKANKLPVNLPSLNNSGDRLYLMNKKRRIIDSANYVSSQFANAENGGGQSLELINPDYFCTDASNWKISTHPNGGSPGEINSVHEISAGIRELNFLNVEEVNDSIIKIHLSGNPNPEYFFPQYFSSIPEMDIKDLFLEEQRLLTIIPNELLKENESYKISVNNVLDCYGKEYEEISSYFINPGIPNKNELIINEVLFNPFTGESDFVEILNISGKHVDLSKVYLTNILDSIVTLKRLSDSYEILSPGDYMAFSENSGQISSRYFSAERSRLRTADLPSFNDKYGSVVLLREDSVLIDFFNYNESMHFSLIDNVEGVSLERITINGMTNDNKNWTSASSTSGFATPGKSNSQLIMSNSVLFNLEPDIFSPDNDGYNDVLSINYSLNEAGNAGNIKIFDNKGRLIRNLVENQSLELSGNFIWDGHNNHNEKVSLGYYLVVFETINQNGEVKKEVSTVVVAGMFK